MPRKLNRRRFMTQVAAASSASALPVSTAFACGSDTVKIRKKFDLKNLDPADYDPDDEPIMRSVLAPPFRAKEGEGSTLAHVALDGEMKSGDRVAVIRFRGDEVWSNGRPLKTDDFVYSINRIIDPAFNARRRNVFENVESCEKTSKYQAEIKLKAPDADFISMKLHGGAGCIVPKDAVESLVEKRFTTNPPETSGRYRIASRVPGDEIVLKCDGNWHGPKATFDEVIFKIIEDDDVAAAKLEAGEIDHMHADDIELYKKGPRPRNSANSRITMNSIGSGFMYFLGFNQRNEVFRDAEIRRAMQVAVDPARLSEMFAVPALTPTANFFPLIYGMDSSPVIRPDPGNAGEFLQSRGVRRITLWRGSRANGQERGSAFKRVLEENIAAALGDIGIDVDIDRKTQWREAVKSDKFGIFVGAVSAVQQSPVEFARQMLQSGFYRRLGGFSEKEAASRISSIRKRRSQRSALTDLAGRMEKEGHFRVLGNRNLIYLHDVRLRPAYTPFGLIGDPGDFRWG